MSNFAVASTTAATLGALGVLASAILICVACHGHLFKDLTSKAMDEAVLVGTPIVALAGFCGMGIALSKAKKIWQDSQRASLEMIPLED